MHKSLKKLMATLLLLVGLNVTALSGCTGGFNNNFSSPLQPVNDTTATNLIARNYTPNSQKINQWATGLLSAELKNGFSEIQAPENTAYSSVIEYTVSDSSGNSTTVQRQIPYYDPIPPTILLEGEMYYAITVGTAWEDPGFVTVDNVAGDLTEQTLVEGEVDCFHPGMYFVNYTATDTHDNRRTATRLIEVVAQPRPQTKMPEGRVIYLTFDDGPGPYTEQLLAVLNKYNVKATFFVMNGDYNHLMKKIVDEGHAIGIHSVTHDYYSIYESPEAYFTDLTQMQEIIYKQTGVRTSLMRFPGGGSNLVSKRYSPGIMSLLTQAVQDAGFQYFDWNVDSEDAGGAQTAREVYKNVTTGVMSGRVSVVLQHDIHPYSVEAVEDLILWGLDNGYTFLPLEQSSPTFHHPVYN